MTWKDRMEVIMIVIWMLALLSAGLWLTTLF
jgi:hypothetical protein